ncbi:uncharacterized protein [Temnothorax longispinosus]|uniref:uncharacterized protein isoform X4 n=1 Tax=Temnothorax longispinosus TaxID=300112 RepID=UPI003A98DB02
MERHNIRAMHGREKGRFVSKSKYRWRQNVLASKKKAAPPAVSNVPDFEICGRRIVELKTLALNLWCIACDIPLSLRYVKSEQKFGLASVLDVKCVKCNKIYTIHTNKHLLNERLYHVNLKAATAMIDGGIGESQLNIILSALDIPSFSTATLKRNERIVGPAIESVARNSCREAIKVEKSLTVAASITPEAELSNNPEQSNDEENSITMAEVNQEESVKIVVSYDAGWQKRGTGRAYNSLSGQGSLIGHRSKLILGYAVRCKACAFCTRGHSRDDHDCRKNYEGSAKSMEPDMAVELIVHNQHLKDENVCVNVLIGDDDSSTIAAVRRESTTRIDKWSDLNHASKAMINALYGLKLPTKIIEYFSRCFTCAIKKNEGNPEAVKDALKNVVSHAFGSHERCGEWCRYSSMGEKYQHKGLPHGKPLSDPQLKSALTSVFTRFANNSDKLAPCGSSQGNESFNSTVASKAPKSKYYGASESLNFRVAASVCQKNIGVTYIEQIYKELNLSPSTVKFRESKENVRKRKIENLRTVEAKRRRLFHKKNRSSKMASVQRREGITYETDSGLNSVSGFIDESPYQADTSDHQDAKIVIFDLETTGLSKSSEICQIAAVHEKETFNAYIVPAGGMSSRAAEVTGLQIHGGEMFLNDQQVDTTPPQMAFKNFIAYLRSIGNSIILTAHNGFRILGQRNVLYRTLLKSKCV